MTTVRAVSLRAFELFASDGMSLGLYVVDDHWESFTKLRSVERKDETVIVDREVTSDFGEQRMELKVVKASPDVAVRLK